MKNIDRGMVARAREEAKARRQMMEHSLRGEAFAVRVHDHIAVLKMIETLCASLLNEDRES